MTQHYTVLGTRWFSGAIGIVAIETNMHEPSAPVEWKAYIGVGRGLDEGADIQQIAAWGTGLEEHEARAFFPRLESWPYKRDE